MEFDRKIQRNILELLAVSYPLPPDRQTWLKIVDLTAKDDGVLAAHLAYLEEHGLIISGVTWNISRMIQFNSGVLKMTAKGMDFIADDGGLGAILNTVTVKFHDDSLARLNVFLQKAPIDQEAKRQFLTRLKELPADATKHVVLKLMDLGLENVPKALQLLQTSLG